MKHLLLLVALIFAGATTMAQNRPESFNYKRGLEGIQNENLDEALEYFNKDLKENTKNGYSYSWIAMIYNRNEEYGKALNAANMAIKYLPKKDQEYIEFAYATRGNIYLNLEDTTKAINDYTSAINLCPNSYELYENRADIYFEQAQYDLADADYQKYVKLNSGGVMGYMGLGRNANAKKEWDAAIKQFDYVVKLASDYPSGYSFRAEAYIGLKKWDDATNDLISALNLDWDRKAIYLMCHLENPATTMMTAKLRVQAAKNPNEPKWPYLQGLLYEQNKQHEKAIKAYNDAIEKEPSSVIYYRIAMCQYEEGLFNESLQSIDRALELDSTDVDLMSYKANVYYEMGKPDLAIREWDKVLAFQPDFAWGYYRRGWFKDLCNDMDGAIEDLTMSIVLDPEYAYAFACRGDVYTKQGQHELAEADYRKVIELENTPEKYECIQYAYLGLGQKDKAIAAMDTIIARDPKDAGNYYDATCIYSKMQDTENALKNLEKALELGYSRFAHIERDDDMDFIRNTEEFKALLDKYKSKKSETGRQTGAILGDGMESDMIVTEIPFVKESGVCKVNCHINGLPLHFIFDTGASDVTLSMVEATFMMKNGYLSRNDVVGKQRYMNAEGDVNVGTVINLKKVSFGELELNNVRASVVRSQKAPLLLGQSVLSRLGKIEIDNPGRVLKITHRK